MNLTGQLDVIDLTTQARVMQLSPESQASSDATMLARIDRLITDVSARIGRYIGLHLSEPGTDRTEVYRMRKHQRLLALDAKPLVSVTTVRYAGHIPADWTTITALGATLYAVDFAAGAVEFLTKKVEDPGFVQVIYRGGFGAAAANVISDFPDLAQACDIQVKYMAERLKSMGGNVQTIVGAGTSFEGGYKLHPEVVAILATYRRGFV